MFLSDQNIREALTTGALRIDGLYPDAIQPASVDIHLHPRLLLFASDGPVDIDKDQSESFVPVDLSDGQFLLEPGHFALGSTVEWVAIPSGLVCRIEGISTNGRCGLMIHATAGWIDPGFRGNLTLEISNQLPVPVVLKPYMRIGQLAFAELVAPATNPYKGRYQDQILATGARSARH